MTALTVARPARFGDLFAAEWIKLRSLRSTAWTLVLTTVFVVGSAAVAALADVRNLAGGASGRMRPDGFLPFDAYPPAGYLTLMLVAGSAGALTVVSEYGTGSIRTTTVAVPARGSVVLAKAVVTAVVWTAAGAVISTGSFLVSQAILDGEGLGVSFTHPGVARALVASALLAPVCGVFGVGLGVLIRHSAMTMVSSAFLLLMLPMLFSTSRRWSADVNHATLFAAWKRLVQNWGDSPDNLEYTATVPGSLAVFVLWPLVAVVSAVVTVRRRDV